MGNGYSQYPNDYSQTVFQSFYAQSSAPTQIAVHREDKLIYYGYIRKLDAEQYIGLCVVLNSVMLTDFKGMFSIFENAITSMVVNGTIILLNDKGDIVSKVGRLYTNQTEVSRITDYLRNEFTNLDGTSRPLPPISYGIAKNEKRTFSIDDNVNDIIKASTSYSYTFIYKQKDFDTQSLNSYRGIVSRLNKENSEITQKYIYLQKEHAKVLKQKKQFQLVVFLSLAILACGVGLLFLNDSLKSTQVELSEANQTIFNKNQKISELNDNIETLNENLREETECREQIENEFSSFKSSLNDIQPFIVKSTSFNFDTGWLSFDYYSFRDDTITIQVKAFGENSYSNSSSIPIEEGYHSESIYLSRDLNKSEWYSFELLINNKIVGGDMH